MLAGQFFAECLAFLDSAPPSPPAATNPFASPVVTASAASLDGFDTYTLAVTLTGTATNLYTIYGNGDSPMSVPAGYQEATPFGANTGGTNPAFWDLVAGSQYDSWLTVGITSGDSSGALSSIGIDFNAWTVDSALSTSYGAVFWMAPELGPAAGTEAVVAQVTVTAGSSGRASMGMQGRSSEGEDWRADNVEFTY